MNSTTATTPTTGWCRRTAAHPQGEFEAQYHYDALAAAAAKRCATRAKPNRRPVSCGRATGCCRSSATTAAAAAGATIRPARGSPLAALEQAGDSRSADIYWYHTDLNSAPLEVTDAAGNLCWSGQYDTFGKLQARRWPARRSDRARNISSRCATPAISGRRKRPALQPVPLLRTRGGAFHHAGSDRLRGGLNLYQYAPNPLMWVDPLGLMSCSTDAAKLARNLGPQPMGREIDPTRE